jgi:hypothetical protein
MKKIALLLAVSALFFALGCEKDNLWGDGKAELEHVYYVTFEKNIFGNYLFYEIAAGGNTRSAEGASAAAATTAVGNAAYGNAWYSEGLTNAVCVPVRLNSERVRSYNAVSKLWVTADNGLTVGTDYSITFENGSAVPFANGVYSLTWPETKKGIQKVKVNRLTASTGQIKVYLLDPSKGAPATDETYLTADNSVINNKTAEYEILGISYDYDRIRVDFK